MIRAPLNHLWVLASALALLVAAVPAAAQESRQPPADGRIEPIKPIGVQPPAAPAQTAPAQPAAVLPAEKPGGKVLIPSGTHLPLILHNGISTRSAKIGDPVYLETLFPVMIDGKVVIPAGSYVSGEITESKRPGRVKGRGELMVRLNTLILPNAYQVNLNAAPSNAGTGGAETVDNEGKIKGDSSKGADVGTVMTTTAAGAGIGGLATRTPAGAGIGAGVGAAAGLVAVLLTRGPEAELPRGTSLEAVLNRPLELDADKVQFAGPGQSSTLAGPPNREPQRSRLSPF
ncbi:MAG TPA: hypothetical protein VEF54_01215 [archaeon]|nr:hypothetical protein [archaeon]